MANPRKKRVVKPKNMPKTMTPAEKKSARKSDKKAQKQAALDQKEARLAEAVAATQSLTDQLMVISTVEEELHRADVSNQMAARDEAPQAAGDGTEAPPDAEGGAASPAPLNPSPVSAVYNAPPLQIPPLPKEMDAELARVMVAYLAQYKEAVPIDMEDDEEEEGQEDKRPVLDAEDFLYALGMLAQTDTNRELLFQAGVLEALLDMLRQSDLPGVVLDWLDWVIYTMAATAPIVKALWEAGAVSVMYRQLRTRGTEPSLVSLAMQVLATIAGEGLARPDILTRKVPALVRTAMRRYPQDVDILAAGLAFQCEMVGAHGDLVPIFLDLGVLECVKLCLDCPEFVDGTDVDVQDRSILLMQCLAKVLEGDKEGVCAQDPAMPSISSAVHRALERHRECSAVTEEVNRVTSLLSGTPYA
ncbi:hypothetical protein KIPB_004871 [Kipferlia bialata]|uniref:Uncharacterized protein n=1 Tax=Kipferlia bialata TaxID=797122 RepID=A0A9K3CWN0_9EUKA|nr:hypothetical protein KIPB_004871 [Kipferlia bialata]|eukprot:g4871.t1